MHTTILRYFALFLLLLSTILQVESGFASESNHKCKNLYNLQVCFNEFKINSNEFLLENLNVKKEGEEYPVEYSDSTIARRAFERKICRDHYHLDDGYAFHTSELSTQRFIELLFSPYKFKLRQSKKNITKYDTLYCFGTTKSQKIDFFKKAHLLASEMLNDAFEARNNIDWYYYQNSLRNYVPLRRSLSDVKNRFNTFTHSFVNIRDTGQVAYVDPSKKPNHVFLNTIFFQDTIIAAASYLIHEAFHLYYPGPPRGDLDHEQQAMIFTELVLNNTYKSQGIIPIGYSNKQNTTDAICGFPIIIKTSKTGKIANGFVFHNRSNNWIGGAEVCDRKYPSDLNEYFQFKSIEEWKLDDKLDDKLYQIFLDQPSYITVLDDDGMY